MKNQQQEAPLEHYYAKYRELDPADAISRTGVSFDEEAGHFALAVLGYTVFAQWPEFKLIPAEPERCPKILYSFYMQIIAVRYLLEGVYTPPRGGFKSYRELPWGELYDANFQGRCIKRLAFSFGSRVSDFASACELLGGVRLSLGDVSYDLPFLGGITIRLILWGADEEFPPSSQFLFSDNTQLAFNAEDLAGVGDVIIGALKEVS